MKAHRETCGSEVDDGGRVLGYVGTIFEGNTGRFSKSEKSGWLGEGKTYEG